MLDPLGLRKRGSMKKNLTSFLLLLLSKFTVITLFICLGSMNTAMADTSVFLGPHAGEHDQSSPNDVLGSNVGVGNFSLYANTIGSSNVAVGSSSLGSNTTGSSNTATGVSSLRSNTIGFANTASGINSIGSNTSGFANTAFGYSSLSSNTTGNGNIAIGSGAGDRITTGSNNIIIGLRAQVPSATGSNQLSIGNTIYGNTLSGNVGIGIPNPTSKLHVDGVINAKGFLVDGQPLANSIGTVVSSINSSNLIGTGSISGTHSVAGTLNFATGSLVTGDIASTGTIKTTNSTGTGKTMSDLLSLTPRSTAPATAVAGDVYASNKGGGIALCMYSGTAWVKVGGNAACPG